MQVSQRFKSKGGSINTISYACLRGGLLSAIGDSWSIEYCCSQCRLSISNTLDGSAFNRLRLSLNLAAVVLFVSKNFADWAPRDRASKPSAPVPAKRSNTLAPRMSAMSQLKRVSRSRSPVGLSPFSLPTVNFRPRHCPPMIRILDSVKFRSV